VREDVFIVEVVDGGVMHLTDFAEGEVVVGTVGAFVEVGENYSRVDRAKVPTSDER
jgi:hypothetical protein